MNYYLVPESIAESLQLKEMRKSTGDGLYLLSEYDLQPYGIERAENEGAVELSLQRKPIPGQEPEEQQVNANAQEEPVEEEMIEVEVEVQEEVGRFPREVDLRAVQPPAHQLEGADKPIRQLLGFDDADLRSPGMLNQNMRRDKRYENFSS